jgi:hypothetical protein
MKKVARFRSILLVPDWHFRRILAQKHAQHGEAGNYGKY